MFRLGEVPFRLPEDQGARDFPSVLVKVKVDGDGADLSERDPRWQEGAA